VGTDDGGDSQPVRVIPASKWFSRILVIVTVLMFICLVVWVACGVTIADPSQSQTDTIDNVQKAFFGCLGTLLGTIGGKVA
jgi:hypothetical protein